MLSETFLFSKLFFKFLGLFLKLFKNCIKFCCSSLVNLFCLIKFVKKYNNTLKYKHMADVLSDEVERMERLLIKKLSHID
mgnify:CR=1 FL=1